MGAIVFIVPGRRETKTGGYIYDRRMVDELRALGWTVEVREIDGSFPDPTSAALAEAARVLAAVPDDTTVVVDGLAYGAMPAQAERERTRLRLVALVHHPLAAETGLSAAVAARLKDSEIRALACARRVIVTSPATGRALADYGVGADRITVVEPGTDRAPRATGSTGDIVQLLCVASLTPRKGHDTLIAALATIADLSWHLTCVGSLERDSAMVARLRAQLRAHGLEGRVSLMGEADEAGVAEHYDRADVFVLPTEYEGYGMVVAEALARGLPVISTTTGAIPDLVKHDSGILVPPGDVAALAAALSSIVREASLRRRLAQGAILTRDRLPSWKVAALHMDDALARVATDEHVQR
jgi:glycosyltransferase involved in cell wall biosynthesis